jgi:hypothetical protein
MRVGPASRTSSVWRLFCVGLLVSGAGLTCACTNSPHAGDGKLLGWVQQAPAVGCNACGTEPTAPATALTGQGVKGATVFVNAKGGGDTVQATTDSAGAYSMDLAPGTYDVTAQCSSKTVASGKTRTWHVTIASGQSTAVVLDCPNRGSGVG